MKDIRAVAWTALNGKKMWIAVIGFALEAGAYLLDNPPMVAALPEKWQGAVNGGLAMLLALGILHKGEKKVISDAK